MRPGPVAAMLRDGRRLHLLHGPIDLVIEAFGAETEVRRAYDAATSIFGTVLADLVSELALLRAPHGREPEGTVAKAMWQAVGPYAGEFITPMAAVAGSVADHVLTAMTAAATLERAYVNNGGDIALAVNDGHFRIGICDDPGIGLIGGRVEIRPGDGIGGVATSGWRGRSFSLGIADAVTVLAPTAAEADAAATMIANRIDLPGSAKITRRPARDLSPDSDLGDRFVTVEVGALDASEIEEALASGRDAAKDYHARGLFRAAYLALGTSRITVPDEERPQIGKE
jgi:uncharacterized protein